MKPCLIYKSAKAQRHFEVSVCSCKEQRGHQPERTGLGMSDCWCDIIHSWKLEGENRVSKLEAREHSRGEVRSGKPLLTILGHPGL